MNRTPKERIQDVLTYIDKCNQFKTYLKDENPIIREMAVRSIIQNITVIGEAVNHLPESLLKDYPEIPWKQVIGIRHLIVHQYHGIDNSNIIEIVEEDLPFLKVTLLKMREQMG